MSHANYQHHHSVLPWNGSLISGEFSLVSYKCRSHFDNEVCFEILKIAKLAEQS